MKLKWPNLRNVFLVGLWGLQSMSNPVKRPCTGYNVSKFITNQGLIKTQLFAIVHWESFKENVLLTGCTTTALLLDSLSVGVFIKLWRDLALKAYFRCILHCSITPCAYCACFSGHPMHFRRSKGSFNNWVDKFCPILPKKPSLLQLSIVNILNTKAKWIQLWLSLKCGRHFFHILQAKQ